MSQPGYETPLMQQYLGLKEKAQGALLFFRMGDFYELFGPDAIEASRILEITLTSRDRSSPDPVPMAGVPHHSAQGYIQRLLHAGKKVAIAEQMEDPSSTKGIVRRDIVRLFTPAIQFEAQESGGQSPLAEEQFLATIALSLQGWSLICLDPSTGEARISSSMGLPELTQELQTLLIRYLILPEAKCPPDIERSLEGRLHCLVEKMNSPAWTISQAEAVLALHFPEMKQWMTLDPIWNPLEGPAALGFLISAVCDSQKISHLKHLKRPAALKDQKTLHFGPRTVQHLDLTPSPQTLDEGTPTLFAFLNRTRTRLGSRLLKRWILSPLTEVSAIEARQETIYEFSKKPLESKPVLDQLKEIYDLDRLMGRIGTRLANPRDTLALGRSLEAAKTAASLGAFSKTPLARKLFKELQLACENLADLTREILTFQKEEAPLVSRDGGIFAKGKSPELDRLIELSENGEKWLIDLEARERAATGIGSLKVRYNRVFGYYIEVTKSNLKSVPASYQRKQSTVNGERFFTDELKKFEDEFVSATTKQKNLELVLFQELLERIEKHTPELMRAADAIAQIDALMALALVAQEPGWCFPKIDESLDLEIHSGRHPLVEATLGGRFVPNALSLSPKSRNTLLITGPNMGGKSTLMRQTALIVILGQMGSAVPASQARWGKFSSVFTRIGAQDAISRGQSTFMVEMNELAQILRDADSRSFIVLDEIGRGTSTYDGISVAWATLEWLCEKTQARTLFATHYHELTHLDQKIPRLANAHMAVAQGVEAGSGKSLRFLYLLKEGAVNDSFGIQVAELAGLPASVVERAWAVLSELEAAQQDSQQLSFFSKPTPRTESPEKTVERPPHPALEKLSALNINETTPMAALKILEELKALNPSV